MKYFDKNGNELSESEIDLDLGYLVDRTTETVEAVPAVTHIEKKDLGDDFWLSWVVVDTPAIPAHEEVTEQTYILYEDEPSIEDRVAALETAVDMLTDVLG